jgi:hypothetical protein
MSLSQNRMVLSGFNNQFAEFLEDISFIFPNNTEINSAKTSLLYLRKINPTVIIGFWRGYIIPRYAAQIEVGDCDFFLKKDYSIDVDQHCDDSKSSEIVNAINRFKGPLSELSPSNMDKCIKYLQNLTKLAMLYEN